MIFGGSRGYGDCLTTVGTYTDIRCTSLVRSQSFTIRRFLGVVPREGETHEKVHHAMTTRMTWPDLCRSDKFRGLWVAIDNCRYDQATRQPVEGDVVDSDSELSELCARMREAGRCACTILFCDGDVYVEPGAPARSSNSAARRAMS